MTLSSGGKVSLGNAANLLAKEVNRARLFYCQTMGELTNSYCLEHFLLTHECLNDCIS